MTPEEMMKLLQGRPKVDLTLNLNDNFFIDLNKQIVEKFDNQDSHLRLKISEQNLNKIFSGKLDANTAYAKGDLFISGDFMSIMKLQELFDD